MNRNNSSIISRITYKVGIYFIIGWVTIHKNCSTLISIISYKISIDFIIRTNQIKNINTTTQLFGRVIYKITRNIIIWEIIFRPTIYCTTVFSRVMCEIWIYYSSLHITKCINCSTSINSMIICEIGIYYIIPYF